MENEKKLNTERKLKNKSCFNLNIAGTYVENKNKRTCMEQFEIVMFLENHVFCVSI